MTKIFSLFGSIALDGMSTVTKQLSGLDNTLKNTSKALAKTGRDLTKLGTTLTKEVTAPIAAVATALGVATGKLGTYADHMLDLEQITGLSTDTLQEFENVSRYAGVSFDGLVGAITKFTNQLPEIIKGGNASSKAFSTLGVSLYDVHGNVKDMNLLFPEMIKALQGVENVSTRNALAQDIFGRSLTDLAPVLGMTADELDTVRDAAHESGLVMSKEAIIAANKLRIETEMLKAQFTMAWREVALNFVPVMRDTVYPVIKNSVVPAMKDLVGIIKSAAEKFGELNPETREAAVKFLAVAAAIGPLLIVLGSTMKAVAGLRSTVLLLHSALLANPFFLAATAVGVFTAAILGAANKYKELQKEHEKFSVMTADQAGKNQFLKNYDAMLEKMKSFSDSGMAEKELMEALTEDIKKVSEEAGKLGYVVKGTDQERAKSLSTIAAEIRGVRDATGALIKYTGAKKEAEKAGKELTEEELKEIKKLDELRKTINERIEADKEETKRKSIEYDIEQLDSEIDTAKQALAAYERLDEERIASIKDKHERELAELSYKQKKEISECGENQEALDALAEAHAIERKRVEEKINKEKDEKITKTAEDEADKRASIASVILDGANNLFSSLTAFSDLRLEQIESEQAAEEEKIESSTMSEEEKEAALEALDEKYAKKKRELNRRQAILDKVTGIFSIGISTAQAIMQAFASLPYPANIVAAAFAAATGAVQTAIVAAKPIPMAEGALVSGGRGGVNALIGEAHQDEIVLPMETGVEALASALMNRISEFTARLMSTVFATETKLAPAGAEAYYGGGGDGGLHLHVGTLIADERGLKQLERTLYRFRVAESTRTVRSGA